MREIPALITYDIHVSDIYPASEVEKYLHFVLAEHDRLGIRASFFFPAEAAVLLRTTIRPLLAEGHEIGCHGLTHRNEFYNCLPVEEQREKLRIATHQLEEVIQKPVRFFRAPAFKISSSTIQILEELGYQADLSVNSQRLGLLSSDVWNFGWMIAPRLPYHPNVRLPYWRGNSTLWEIPLSCLILPFMSNTGLAFGLSFLKAFFKFFYCESKLSGKPIVYLTHPEELYPWRKKPQRRPIQWRDLIPSRDRGFALRYSFYERDPSKIAHQNRVLLESMRALKQLKFFTVPEYVGFLNGHSMATS